MISFSFKLVSDPSLIGLGVASPDYWRSRSVVNCFGETDTRQIETLAIQAASRQSPIEIT
jgi:hypothetical protein